MLRYPMKAMTSCGWIALCACVVFSFNGLVYGADSWTQWRGPTGQGLSNATGLPEKWSEKENIAWRTELPGKGWSSPVIDGNEIWMTTAVEFTASPEEAKK